MELYHVSTHLQATDCLTKSLPSKVLKKHQILLAGEDKIAARISWLQVTKADVSVEEPFSLRAEVKKKSRYVGCGDASLYDKLKNKIVGRGDFYN
eukprot:3941802-Rhodomonas_salina.1